MKSGVTLRKVITLTKLSLFIIWFWPLQQNSTKRKILCMKLYQYITLTLIISMVATILYSIINNLHDTILVIKSALGLFPCGHAIWNILCHLIIYRRLQCVTLQMEESYTLMKLHEQEIIQREYVDKYANFYGFSITSFYMGVFALLVRPFVLDESLPVSLDYPFDVSHQSMWFVAYAQQVTAGLLVAAHLSSNGFMALLLWSVSARFKMLFEEFRTTKSIYDFTKCIKKHQQLLKYATEVTFTIRPFAIGTVLFSTISIIIFSLILIARVPLSLKIQCIFLAFNGLLEVFMYAWPAEHLIYISNHITQAVFGTNWYNKPINFQKKLQMVMLRSQRPLVITLPCGLPSLSLRYYATYLSTIFSYFTTLRIMFDKK